VVRRTQRLPHRHGHEELLGELLLAEGDRAAGHHDALASVDLALGYLLDDGRQSSKSQAVLVLPRYDGAAELDDQPTSVFQLAAFRERLLSPWSLRRLQLPPHVSLHRAIVLEETSRDERS